MSEDNPQDLLVKRLIRKEKEIEKLTALLDKYRKSYEVTEDIICKIIESLPEPIVFRDVANNIEDSLYKEYIFECANLFEVYKSKYEVVKRELGK